MGGQASGRAAAGVVSTLVLATALAGCGSAGADADTLTVYSAQHESLVRTMLEDFTEETGIELEFRDANDSELANQIIEEGEAFWVKYHFKTRQGWDFYTDDEAADGALRGGVDDAGGVLAPFARKAAGSAAISGAKVRLK